MSPLVVMILYAPKRTLVAYISLPMVVTILTNFSIGWRKPQLPLNREHVAIGFRAIWQMKLKYCLGATCFSKKQCDKLQALYLPAFLSTMGINRTTATAVRHGSTSLGGMNVIHLETEQAAEHTKLMISHLRKEDELGRMIQTSIDHLQTQAGTSWAVLSRPGKKA